ncbi:MATE family efflux transporter [Desulfovibrio sp. OttesenSCG-928-G15]|nr:MATE family efflux transporter [Desulfovibrio sp. OttesenSCG-928-G15]
MARSMTQGSPARLILSFAVPLLIGNLFQQVYTMVDTLIVGRTIGVTSLAAVGSTGGIMFFVIGFVQAMTNGFSIITAQNFGAKKAAMVRKSFCVSITLSAIAAVVLSALGLVFVKDVLLLLQTPEEILEEAYSYAVIICGGIGSAVLYNLLANTIMALGDSRPSLAFLIIACVLNIALDLLFILGFSWGVAGAALATVTAQCSSCFLCIIYIIKKVPALRLRKKDWKIATRELVASAKLGLPMGFQASIIATGAIILQWALNTLGPISVAAFTVVRSIDMIAILPLASFGLAMGTYVGQNYGAGDIDRIRLGVRQCCVMSLSFSAFIALVNITGGRMLVAIFVGPGQEDVTVLAQKFLIINGCMYWVLALLFIFRFSLQGLGKSFAPTVAGVMELFMRALAAIVLTKHYGFVGACLASPLAWAGACIPLAIAYHLNIRALLRKHRTHST